MSHPAVTDRVASLIRPEIRALSAYSVPSAEGMLKLDAMENPYSWPAPLKKAWLERLEAVAINRYPEPAAAAVKEGLARMMKIPERYDLLLGNGSDEIIQLLAMAVAEPGRTVLAPEPSFVMYRMIATFTGMAYRGVALDSDFDLDVEAMLAAIAAEQPALIFLAQPNNPTGNLFSEDRVRAILEASEGLVVVDEAYTAFTEADSLKLLDEYDNLVIMRTLSKVGLAGLRLGLLVGQPAWLTELEKLRLPYNINVLTQASAAFALEHYDVLRAQTRQLQQNRVLLSEALGALPGLQVWPSEANFLLVRTPEGQAAQLHQGLREQGILVKLLDGAHPALADCLRINVSSEEENAALLQALAALLGG
ncbi:histidinol-phosphate transaminase [Motiliproteus sp. SC1-56]|uniref:histidinol-phosphate transaminase n=1 Tax=Motiliproteus sp. SC1-56 TaxID=2799565 RepID=UPI001A8EAB0C|nr:histidinol-phosphate transaminase [Motiliproteus sp. SC1-56]